MALPVLMTASCTREVDVDMLGQLVADAVTVADVPVAADVVLVEDGPDARGEAVAYAWRTGQPAPGRVRSWTGLRTAGRRGDALARPCGSGSA